MKKLQKAFAIFAAIAMLGSAFIACKSDDDNGGSDTTSGSQPAPGPTTGATIEDYVAPSITGDFYPASGSTDAFVDTDLYVVYTSDITINRDSTAKITISDGTTTDEIAVKDEKYDVDGCNKVTASVNVNKELVIASGKVLVIKPHSILTPGKTYTVTVPAGIVKDQEPKTWSFTPKAINVPADKVITVGTDCSSINGAIKSIDSSGDWTIKVSAGSYHEILGYYGSANLTIIGAESAYGADTKVYWNNSQALGNSQRTRQSFIWEGGNLTIKNMTFRNTANRAEEGNVNIQAETLYFDCQADLIVYNSSFSSYQDTLIIGNNGGRAWFYKCLIEGDVDFIWGYADVALFEECKIVCLADGIKNDAKIFASRTVYDNTTSKGFVLLNSEVTIQDKCSAAYGRSSGADTQASVINTSFKTEGTGTLVPGLWGSASDRRAYEPNGEMAVGYKDYNNTLNGSAVETSARIENTSFISDRLYNREYNGRWTIFNRTYDPDNGVYNNAASVWDISTYEAEFNATAETSVENIYVDPVYKENVIGGNTVQLTPKTTSSAALTYTYKSSDTSIATVDENGLVTAATGVTGSSTITVTASNGKKDFATIAVIPAKISVEGLALTAPSAVDVYALNTVTAVFTPADASVKTLTWTATGDIKIVDPATKKIVTTLETAEAEIQIEGVKANGSGTITATSVDTSSVSISKTISVSTVRDYNAVEAVAVNNNDADTGFGILNFQSGKVGMWHDLYVHAIHGSQNGKIAASGERVQSRYGTIYIPVTANCYIDVTCQKWNDTSLWVTDFTDLAGNEPKTYEDTDEETYRYHYKWDLDVTNDTAKLKSGADVLALFNASTKDTNRSWAGKTPDESVKYFGIVIPGVDRYWTHIKVTEDPSIQHEAASASLTLTSDFAYETSELDLNGITTVTQTVAASASDSTTPAITYASDNTAIATVDATTGKVTAVAIGMAKITATVAHPTDSSVAKLTSTYTVTVKDTSEATSYTVNFAAVAGVGSAAPYDFGKFTSTNGKYHGSTYGWIWGENGTLTVPVKGSSTITIYNSYNQYPSGTAISVSTSDTTASLSTASLTASYGDHKGSPEALSVTYTTTSTETATVTFTFAATQYLSKVEVVSANATTVYANGKYDFATDYATIAGYTLGLNGFAISGGEQHGYGWVMKNGGTAQILVSGNCTVTFTGSVYSSGEVNASASAGSITPAQQTCITTEDKTGTYVFTYTGDEATLTFGCATNATQAYTPSITVTYN